MDTQKLEAGDPDGSFTRLTANLQREQQLQSSSMSTQDVEENRIEM